MMKYIDKIYALQHRSPGIFGEDEATKYAIFLPLIRVKEELHVLFEVRAHHLRRQPGEICFPGGKIDKDDDHAKAAAIRETLEELNLHSKDVSIVAPLDIMVGYGQIIEPFVGEICQDVNNIFPNKDEVEEIFTVPLDYFMDTKPEKYLVELHPHPSVDFPFHYIPNGKKYNWRMRGINELFYEYNGRVIWGLTAKILYHFVQLVQKSKNNNKLV
jgi:peroxisomal coenzyme A diphosphatase NUDT7